MNELEKHKLDKLSCGNISLRLSNNLIAIKPTGMSYNEVNIENVSKEFEPILIEGEKIEKAYKLIKDMFIFTNKRL